jgi:hypothetical protein
MKNEDLKCYLRQSRDKKNGEKGGFCVRLLISDNSTKARRVEIGLRTNKEDEALARTRVIVNAFLACRLWLTNKRIWLETLKGGFIHVCKVGYQAEIPPRKSGANDETVR